VTADLATVSAVSADPSDLSVPVGRAGRSGVMFAAVWLLFLIYPFSAGWHQRDSARGWLGMALTVAFAAAYLAVFVHVRRRRNALLPDWRPAYGSLLLAGLAIIAVLLCWSVGQEGTASLVYLATTGMLVLPPAAAFTFAGVVALANEVSARTVTGWQHNAGLSFAVVAASFAMWGVSSMLTRNVELIRAREENARLAISEERNRFARDLHDILGHSLTVITVKAELAQKLFDVDPERARAEVADLERLSRDALADVRRAVEGYRELTLPGEVARARMALEAAEIRAQLPNSADDVPSPLRELFAWTIREGVTNVVRHSGARTCTVRLTPTSAEVVDDGRGPQATAHAGNGLLGLRERAARVGAAVVTTALQPGFSLKVVAPEGLTEEAT
jgi:two-component system sensor histidine kinase DesK